MTSIKNLFLLSMLITGLGLMLAGRVTAQTITVLHSFSDGEGPYAGLISSGNTVYGTTLGGGSSDNGTVFKVNTDSSGFENLHNFSATSPNSSGVHNTNNGVYTNSDGAGPMSGLVLSGNTLYGTTLMGGSSGNGTVFAVNTDATGFTVLHSFGGGTGLYPPNTDGAGPWGGLIVSGNTLYGTAGGGGSSGHGTVFSLNTDGTGFKVLYSFTGGNDGTSPVGGLLLSGNTLYGTTAGWYAPTNGSVFKVDTDGTGFTTLYTFSTGSPNSSNVYTNGDGARPIAGLVLSDDTLFGTASMGGDSGYGTVFAVNTNGTGFSVLHSFTGGNNVPNSYATLMLSGNTLYGTTAFDGSWSSGTVFTVNTDGTRFTTLYNFTAPSGSFNHPTNSDGANSSAGLLLSGNTLYGTTVFGGNGSEGTVFSISFPPQLSLIPSVSNAILTWPTNYLSFDYTGYTLQSTTNLRSSAVWNPVSSSPVVIGGQKVVVNPISGTQQFFRLSQ